MISEFFIKNVFSLLVTEGKAGEHDGLLVYWLPWQLLKKMPKQQLISTNFQIILGRNIYLFQPPNNSLWFLLLPILLLSFLLQPLYFHTNRFRSNMQNYGMLIVSLIPSYHFPVYHLSLILNNYLIKGHIPLEPCYLKKKRKPLVSLNNFPNNLLISESRSFPWR